MGHPVFCFNLLDFRGGIECTPPTPYRTFHFFIPTDRLIQIQNISRVVTPCLLVSIVSKFEFFISIFSFFLLVVRWPWDLAVYYSGGSEIWIKIFSYSANISISTQQSCLTSRPDILALNLLCSSVSIQDNVDKNMNIKSFHFINFHTSWKEDLTIKLKKA